MISHTILLEILKIILVGIFLILFATYFKKAIHIGKATNAFLLENYSIEEHYRKQLIKKMILKFIVPGTFEEAKMKKLIGELSLTTEFIRNKI